MKVIHYKCYTLLDLIGGFQGMRIVHYSSSSNKWSGKGILKFQYVSIGDSLDWTGQMFKLPHWSGLIHSLTGRDFKLPDRSGESQIV